MDIVKRPLLHTDVAAADAVLRDAFAPFLGVGSVAAAVGGTRLTLGVNTARRDAYRHLLASGFRTDDVGVTMHRPDDEGYDRPEVHLLDDWR